MDSMQFLGCSLATLAGNLKKDTDFTHLRRTLPVAAEAELLMRKGVYPYDYMDSMARFEETRLPSKGQFYNQLNEEVGWFLFVYCRIHNSSTITKIKIYKAHIYSDRCMRYDGF